MILWMIAAAGVSAAQVDGEAAVRAVIASAVQARVGSDVAVAIDLRVIEMAAGAPLDSALPEPGARFGRPARFRLRAAGRTVGYAVGIVHVTMPHLRLTRAVDAGAAITAEDVREVVGDPGSLPVEALPAQGAVVGSTSIRALLANEVVTARIVRVSAAVRSGDLVTTHVVVDGVEAEGVATALQSGSIGDIIRLVNADSRRQLRGRITGKAAVQVQNES